MSTTSNDAYSRRPIERQLTHAGRRLAFIEWPGEEPALVAVPGVCGNAALFAALAEALPDRRVIAIDPPGHGRSSPAPDHDLIRAAAALGAAAAKLCATPPIWIGHSWGGKVVAILAAQQPAQATGIVLIDPSPVGGLDLDENRLQRFVDTAWDGHGGPWPDLETAITAHRGLPHYRNWTAVLETALQRGLTNAAGTWTTTVTRDDVEAISRATLLVDHGTIVETVRCPILYLVASESEWWQQLATDPAIPRHAARIVIDGPHALHIDRPDETYQKVRDWIANLDESSDAM